MSVAADIELVGIKLHYFFFGIMVFQSQGIKQFCQLGPQGAVFSFEQILGSLLCNSTAALNYFAGLDIGNQSSQDTWDIDTKVL